MEASDFSFEDFEPLPPAPAASGAGGAAGMSAALTPDEELAVARAEAEQLRQAAGEQGYQEG